MEFALRYWIAGDRLLCAPALNGVSNGLAAWPLRPVRAWCGALATHSSMSFRYEVASNRLSISFGLLQSILHIQPLP